jgi:hypothetical protein
MFLYQLMKCVAVWDPSDQSRILTKGNNRIASDAQVFLTCLGVDCQQSVDQSKQLHHSLILSNVFVTLQKEHVLAPITSVHLHLSWVLFR